MSKLYRSREGDITSADAKTGLTTLGSESAPGPLLVPAGAKSLNAIIVAFGPDFAAAQDAACFVRLEGPGLPEGPESIVVGGTGSAVATGGTHTDKAVRYEIGAPVVVANEILLFAEMPGEDVGTVHVGVTLEFI